jgi:hypothetical protein
VEGNESNNSNRGLGLDVASLTSTTHRTLADLPAANVPVGELASSYLLESKKFYDGLVKELKTLNTSIKPILDIGPATSALSNVAKGLGDLRVLVDQIRTGRKASVAIGAGLVLDRTQIELLERGIAYALNNATGEALRAGASDGVASRSEDLRMATQADDSGILLPLLRRQFEDAQNGKAGDIGRQISELTGALDLCDAPGGPAKGGAELALSKMTDAEVRALLLKNVCDKIKAEEEATVKKALEDYNHYAFKGATSPGPLKGTLATFEKYLNRAGTMWDVLWERAVPLSGSLSAASVAGYMQGTWKGNYTAPGHPQGDITLTFEKPTFSNSDLKWHIKGQLRWTFYDVDGSRYGTTKGTIDGTLYWEPGSNGLVGSIKYKTPENRTGVFSFTWGFTWGFAADIKLTGDLFENSGYTMGTGLWKIVK